MWKPGRPVSRVLDVGLASNLTFHNRLIVWSWTDLSGFHAASVNMGITTINLCGGGGDK